jgi:hypothetical protein
MFITKRYNLSLINNHVVKSHQRDGFEEKTTEKRNNPAELEWKNLAICEQR